MIILLLLSVFALIFSVLMVTINGLLSLLPFYNYVNDSFAYAIGLFKGIFETLPYLETVYTLFLFAITVEIVFIVAKLILGARSNISFD